MSEPDPTGDYAIAVARLWRESGGAIRCRLLWRTQASGKPETLTFASSATLLASLAVLLDGWQLAPSPGTGP